jgi:hypothetical protein
MGPSAIVVPAVRGSPRHQLHAGQVRRVVAYVAPPAVTLLTNLSWVAWSDIQAKAEIDLVSGLAAANPPVLHRGFVENDEDVAGWDPHLSQVADDRLVERPLGGWRSAREGGDLHEGVVLGPPGGDLEVLGIMLDEPLSAIILWNAECLDQGGMNRLEKTPPLGNGPSLEDLDPD